MSTIKIDLCYNISSQQKQQRTVCCLTTGSTTNLVLLLLILVWLGFSGPVHGVIKNQRVILSDLHLPNNVANGNNSSPFVDDVPDENEGSRTRRTRPKRTLPTGGDADEIRRKAITFGQSEKVCIWLLIKRQIVYVLPNILSWKKLKNEIELPLLNWRMKVGKIEKNLHEKRKSARLLFACECDQFSEQSHCKFGIWHQTI